MSSTSVTMEISEEELIEKSKIFGVSRDPNVKLSRYQVAINKASAELARRDASLLTDNGKRLEMAREKIHNEGYDYRKKSSRSKKFSGSQQEKKRKYIKEDIRQARAAELSSDIKSLQESITFLDKQKEKYKNSEMFLEAANITNRIQEEKSKKRKLEVELKVLTSGKRPKKKILSSQSQSSSAYSPTSTSDGNDTDILSEEDTKPPKPHPLMSWLASARSAAKRSETVVVDGHSSSEGEERPGIGSNDDADNFLEVCQEQQ